MAGPEYKARETINELLVKVGWAVCDRDKANIAVDRGVVITYLLLEAAHGAADYLCYVDGKSAEYAKSTGSAITIQDATSIGRCRRQQTALTNSWNLK